MKDADEFVPPTQEDLHTDLSELFRKAVPMKLGILCRKSFLVG